MTELFPMIAGVVLSLVFSYIPGLNTWYGKLTSQVKSLIMLGLVLVVAGAYFGLSCTPLAADLGIKITCDSKGGWEVVKAFLLILIANQSTYTVTRRLVSYAKG